MNDVRETNDPGLTSWVEVPPGSDFPIQNLPFGIFRTTELQPRAGMAIGEFVIDLAFLHERQYFRDLDLPAGIFAGSVLNDFMRLGRKKVGMVRAAVSRLLRRDNETIKTDVLARTHALIPFNRVTLLMPLRVPNYTDFYSSEEHAFNVGSMFRGPEKALMPNWKHLPVGYHGRASSIVVSGSEIRRPHGQIKIEGEPPAFSASQKLDFELEIAFITCGENPLGHPIAVQDAEDFIAGLVLFNDWSARDIQQWEYVPLGPFLGKNFASTMSPWIVTLDALDPFRVEGPTQEPKVLPYLASAGKKNFDIALEVALRPAGSDETVLCRSNAKYLYWNICQQLAHHTVNGCNVQVGDVYASGTISGPSPGSMGSMLELSWNGKRPLKMPDGTTRKFLEDGDAVTMRGYAEKDGVRVGFGSCVGKIIPALTI